MCVARTHTSTSANRGNAVLSGIRGRTVLGLGRAQGLDEEGSHLWTLERVISGSSMRKRVRAIRAVASVLEEGSDFVASWLTNLLISCTVNGSPLISIVTELVIILW